MSTWTAPITWSNGAVTAATMNTEMRDHLNFLKGALDKITASTTADTGTTTKLSVFRTASSDVALEAAIAADTFIRWRALASGTLEWGSGSANPDVTLSRVAARQLGIGSDTGGGTLVMAGNTTGDEGGELKLSGSAANTDWFIDNYQGILRFGEEGVGSEFEMHLTHFNFKTQWLQMTEIGDPAVAPADNARLYLRDNGAGKTQLAVIFSSGAVQVIATQP